MKIPDKNAMWEHFPSLHKVLGDKILDHRYYGLSYVNTAVESHTETEERFNKLLYLVIEYKDEISKFVNTREKLEAFDNELYEIEHRLKQMQMILKDKEDVISSIRHKIRN